MSGLAQVFLTDHELDLLVRWGELALDNAAPAMRTSSEQHLLGKLRGMLNAVACKPCATCKGAEGETCSLNQAHAVSRADAATR